MIFDKVEIICTGDDDASLIIRVWDIVPHGKEQVPIIKMEVNLKTKEVKSESYNPPTWPTTAHSRFGSYQLGPHEWMERMHYFANQLIELFEDL